MRFRRIAIFFLSAVMLSLSGCLGLIINTTAECESETPHPDIHDIMKISQENSTVLTPKFWIIDPKAKFTKDDFLNEWGQPDKIIKRSEFDETWIYNRNLWCGVVPVLILPIPLILPICDGFDKIDFEGNIATRLDTKHIVSNGGVLFIGYPLGFTAIESAGKDPVCQYPLPAKDNSSETVQK